MKLEIKDYCIRCGLCEDLHGDIFHFNHDTDEIEVKYDEIPSEKEEAAKKAMAECAITAIYLARD